MERPAGGDHRIGGAYRRYQERGEYEGKTNAESSDFHYFPYGGWCPKAGWSERWCRRPTDTLVDLTALNRND